jgi:hypothetical protein
MNPARRPMVLAGCVTTSNIVPAGQDTYMVSAANDTCGNCTPPQIRLHRNQTVA